MPPAKTTTLDRLVAKELRSRIALMEALAGLARTAAEWLATEPRPPVRPDAHSTKRADAAQRVPAADGAGPLGITRDESAEVVDEMVTALVEDAAEEEEPPPPPTADEEFDLWQRRNTLYRRNRLWLPDWGPRPGQGGCRMPAELLEVK